MARQLVVFIRRQASGLVPYTYVKDTRSSGLVLDVGAKLCDWIQNLFPDPLRGNKKIVFKPTKSCLKILIDFVHQCYLYKRYASSEIDETYHVSIISFTRAFFIYFIDIVIQLFILNYILVSD